MAAGPTDGGRLAQTGTKIEDHFLKALTRTERDELHRILLRLPSSSYQTRSEPDPTTCRGPSCATRAPASLSLPDRADRRT